MSFWYRVPHNCAFVSCCAGVVVAASVLAAIFRKAFERFDASVRRKRTVLERMAVSQSYGEWSQHSLVLHGLGGSEKIKSASKMQTRLYDSRLLDTKLVHLKKVFESGDVREVVMALRADLVRKLGNMTDR